MAVEPRPWITVQELRPDLVGPVLCPLPDTVSDYAAQASIEIATHVLYELTGRRWSGTETSVLRPTARDTSANFFPPGWVPEWGAYDGSEGPCEAVDRVAVGVYPVISVAEVRVGGVVVPPAGYQLQNQRDLVRVDGGVWPCTQDLDAPDTAVDTFSITALHGIEPPEAGKYACAIYAVELAKSFCNLDCALPQRTQYMTRQGVSTILGDPLNVIFRGMIGLPTVDSWIRAVNPKGRRRRTMVVSNKNVNDPYDKATLPLSAVRADYSAYPFRGVNRFHG